VDAMEAVEVAAKVVNDLDDICKALESTHASKLLTCIKLDSLWAVHP
jgi:hypothetical protein